MYESHETSIEEPNSKFIILTFLLKNSFVILLRFHDGIRSSSNEKKKKKKLKGENKDGPF